MKVYLIMGQYPCRYEGELMPNVMAAWDEYVMDDNYEGYETDLAKYKSWVTSGDLAAVSVIVVSVPDDAVLDSFHPREVPSTVVRDEPVGNPYDPGGYRDIDGVWHDS